MRVGIYTICKNEEKHILRMIESVLDADEIIILDTGSSDNTIEILKNTSNQYSNVKYYSSVISPWRFDDAKNMALSMLSLDVDVCVSIDADEFMADGWLAELQNAYDPSITRYYHKFKTEWQDGGKTEHWHERIHTRLNYKWNLPVHEYLKYYDTFNHTTETIKWVDDLLMIQRPDRSKSRETYFDLLKISVIEEPNNWKSLFFLGQEYNSRGDGESALEYMKLAANSPDVNEAYINSYISDLYFERSDRNNCINYAVNAALLGNIREYWIYASNKAAFFGDADLSKVFKDIGLGIKNRTSGYEYNQAVWSDNE